MIISPDSTVTGIRVISGPPNASASASTDTEMIVVLRVRPPAFQLASATARDSTTGRPPQRPDRTLAKPCATTSRFVLWRPSVTLSIATAANNPSSVPMKAISPAVVTMSLACSSIAPQGACASASSAVGTGRNPGAVPTMGPRRAVGIRSAIA